MSDFFIVIGVIVSACGILLALLCVITWTLNIALNKHLPFYKDLFEWIRYKRKFKEWLVKEKGENE